MHDEDYCPQEIYGDIEGPMEDGQLRGTLVCTVEGDDEELVRANAHLIKSAPALLAELDSARKVIGLAIDNMPYLFPPQGQRDRLSAEQLAWREKFEAATKSARAVLAKARGQC